MRDMTKEEIFALINSWAWGTLIAVDGDKPYAVEVSYGTDGENIYCGSMPGGRMARCIKANNKVVFKICDSDRTSQKFRAVIIEGKAERLTKQDDILCVIRSVARQREVQANAYDRIAEKIAENPEISNAIRIPIEKYGGKIKS